MMAGRYLLVLAWLLVLASCDNDPYHIPEGTEPQPATLDGEAATVDLATGQLQPSVEAVSAGRLVVQRIAGGEGLVSTADALVDGAFASDATAIVTVDNFYLAPYELTRGQWKSIVDRGGADVPRTPWLAPTPVAAFGGDAVDDQLPATGLSYDMIRRALAAWNAVNYYQLRLPRADEWEYACRSGSDDDDLFAWGDALDDVTVQQFAHLNYAVDDAPGPEPVGSRTANEAGFFDMHGNVWEWVVDEDGDPHLRGASWNDKAFSAMAGNRLALDRAVPYATAGVRLVLEMP